MVFKQLSPTQAKITTTRFSKISRTIISAILAVLTIFMATRLGDENYGVVIGWAFAALLGWHLLFARKQIHIDIANQTISTRVSSIYLIAQQDISIADIKAFRVDKDSTRQHQYKLSIIMDERLKPIRLEFGSLQSMNILAEKLSDFCNKTLLNSAKY